MCACVPDWTVAGGGDGAAAAAGDDGGGDGDDAASLDPQMRAIAACAGLLVAGGVISDLGVIAAAASRGVEVAPRTRPLVPEVADAGASPAPPAQQLLYAWHLTTMTPLQLLRWLPSAAAAARCHPQTRM
jgi:hypothetical protein